ncbi:MAG: TIGR03032 family protein [Phycisphaerales bacterium]
MTKPRNELVLSGSRHVASWLSQYKVSLGFTTYQAGKLFLVGLQPDGRLSIYERTFNRCMGLCVSPDAQTLWMTSLYQLWRFENYLPPGVTTQDGYDRLYVPVTGHTTGDIDLHDIHLDASGNPNFCVTLFNCLGAVSETHSFRPTWRPPFISGLVPEDRCHLNGLAVDPTTQEPAYVTMVGQSDVSDGWRDKRENGGLLMDIASEEIVGEGLSMPHSPRVHPDYPGRVWLLNAGTGYFGYIDTTSSDRSFVEVAFCPGFTRGLSFVGRYALVGMSAAREDRTFQGLPLDANLSAKGAEPRCAIHVINLDTGATEHWIRIEGVVRELYDVVALHGVTRPQMLGFKTDEIRRALRLETDGPG